MQDHAFGIDFGVRQTDVGISLECLVSLQIQEHLKFAEIDEASVHQCG